MMWAPLVARSRRRFATGKNCFGRNGVADQQAEGGRKPQKRDKRN
jgi:hypothetical protein